MASNVLSASRAGVGSAVVTTATTSITAQIVGVGVAALPADVSPVLPSQSAVSVNTG
jgi:hypothetical protein